MSSTVFVDQTTPIVASWLNDVNTATYTTVPALAPLANAVSVGSNNNLGLGVTPSAWGSGGKAFETSGGGFYGFSTTSVNIYNNAYYNGTNWIYKNNLPASNFRAVSGGFDWNVASSGTAGNPITFTQAMTLDSSGNLFVGVAGVNPTGTGFVLSPSNALAQFSHASTITTGAPYAQFLYNGSVIGSISQLSTTGITFNGGAGLNLTATQVTAPTPTTGDSSTNVATTAFVANTALGIGQTWQTFTIGTQRVSGTTYYNTTGKPIQIIGSTANSTAQTVNIVVNGVTVSAQTGGGSGYTQGVMGTAIVPPGASYIMTITGPTLLWAELR
jgi:hypothetical protein